MSNVFVYQVDMFEQNARYCVRLSPFERVSVLLLLLLPSTNWVATFYASVLLSRQVINMLFKVFFSLSHLFVTPEVVCCWVTQSASFLAKVDMT